jgi:thiamine-phosphate pyrophosphorylase
LYVICDADACERAGWTVGDFAAACLDGGATVLQLRAKGKSSAWLLRSAETIVARAAAYGDVSIIVNDRADTARICGAQGVHVGQEDLSPHAVRRIVGERSLVGLSTHTPAQLAHALQEPVSYVAIGPIFATATKNTGHEAVGLDRVRAAAATTRPCGLPVVAIGGITLDRARSVQDAGADALAVISDLLTTNDPRARVAAYRAVLSRV